jgi:CubicO group peptidase (beta-lactamase class C family)
MRALVAITVLAACSGPRNPPGAPPTQPAPAAPVAPDAPPAQEAVTSLVGVWAGAVDFDTGPRGALRVRRTPSGWRAQLGAIDAPLTAVGDRLTGDIGTGKIRIRIAGERLTGHWIQPRTAADSSFASPITFVRDPDGTHRATIEPLRSAAELYLAIADDDTAFLREPGRNLGRRFGTLKVTRTGDTVSLASGDGTRRMYGRIEGRTLHLTIDDLELTAALTPRGRDDAPGFHPRPSTQATYQPSVPRELGDGWRVGTLADAGLAAEPIRALVQSVIDDVPTKVASPAIHGLVIARRGVLVVDEYFAGHGPDRLHDTRSAGKSFTTTLAGIAIDRGALTLDSPVYRAAGRAPDDARKRAITLRHLVTMRTGLACNDRDENSPGNEDGVQNREQDWYGATLALPVSTPAGQVSAYCSMTLNLIGAVLAGADTGASQVWLPERLRDDLLAPLDIKHYAMNLMPDGQGYLAGGLRLRTRDLAKIAQLFLDGGTWRGKRVISAAWTRAATAPHAAMNVPDDYGYGWWRTHYDVDGTRYEAFYASGNGGQLAIAIPALGLVVAFNAGNYGNFGTWRQLIEDLVPRHVIRAALDGAR